MEVIPNADRRLNNERQYAFLLKNYFRKKREGPDWWRNLKTVDLKKIIVPLERPLFYIQIIRRLEIKTGSRKGIEENL